jgi:hypothetical protein
MSVLFLVAEESEYSSLVPSVQQVFSNLWSLAFCWWLSHCVHFWFLWVQPRSSGQLLTKALSQGSGWRGVQCKSCHVAAIPQGTAALGIGQPRSTAVVLMGEGWLPGMYSNSWELGGMGQVAKPGKPPCGASWSGCALLSAPLLLFSLGLHLAYMGTQNAGLLWLIHREVCHLLSRPLGWQSGAWLVLTIQTFSNGGSRDNVDPVTLHSVSPLPWLPLGRGWLKTWVALGSTQAKFSLCFFYLLLIFIIFIMMIYSL